MHTGLRTQGWSLNFEWLDYLSTLRTTVHGPLRLAKGLIPAKRCEPAAHLMCQWCWHIRPDLTLLVCVWGHIWQGVNNPLRPSIIWLWTRPNTKTNESRRTGPQWFGNHGRNDWVPANPKRNFHLFSTISIC